MSEIQPQDRAYMDALAVHMLRYEATHPKPEAPVLERSRLWIKGALAVVVGASLVVSASHTIPTFVGQLQGDSRNVVAIAAFIMVEGTLIVGSYLLHRLHVAWPWLGRYMLIAAVIFAFLIAVAGNLHHRLELAGFAQGQAWVVFDLLTSIVVGIAPPVIALISMEVLAMLAIDDERRHARAHAAYQSQLDAWTEGMRRSWDSQKRKRGAVSVVVEHPNSSAVQSIHSLNAANEQGVNERSVNSSTGYTKRMDAKTVIREFLTAHPEKFNDRLDDLVAEIESSTGVKVGRTSVHNVRKEMQ